MGGAGNCPSFSIAFLAFIVYNKIKWGDFMAKLALVRYGSKGQGPEKDEEKAYTYVVNDNVRAGDRISPVVKHYGEKGTIFSTTGKVVSTTKNASTEKGKEMQAEFDKAKEQNPNAQKTLTEVYTGKELGLGAQRGQGGKFTTEGGKSFSTSANGYILGEREKATRGGNIAAYTMTHGESDKLSAAAQKSVETFKSYSEAFIPTGKR